VRSRAVASLEVGEISRLAIKAIANGARRGSLACRAAGRGRSAGSYQHRGGMAVRQRAADADPSAATAMPPFSRVRKPSTNAVANPIGWPKCAS